MQVKTGVSDDNYTQIVSGLSESDVVAYDPSSVVSDSYYDDGSAYVGSGSAVVVSDAGNGDTVAAAEPEETLPEEGGEELSGAVDEAEAEVGELEGAAG